MGRPKQHFERLFDEVEEDLPNEIAFDLLAKGMRVQMEQPQHPAPLDNTHIPILPEPGHPDQQPGSAIPAINWPAVINAMQGTAECGPFPQQAVNVGNLGDDFTNLGHIFKADAIKPEYELNVRPIPNPILQMAYLKLFIPLSLLTTIVLDRIEFNDGLKFHKIIFGNWIGKHSLDISSFPTEQSLSESEFWQAYRNWLSLIDIIADPAIANSWKLHHAQMMLDKNFSTLFVAWREHDKLLHACFMIDPFMINPNQASYIHQLERCRGEQTCYDSLKAVSMSKGSTSSASSSTPKSSHFQPYTKAMPHPNSFRILLCIRCGRTGHKAANCSATSSNVFNRPIIVNWKGDHLVSKSG